MAKAAYRPENLPGPPVVAADADRIVAAAVELRDHLDKIVSCARNPKRSRADLVAWFGLASEAAQRLSATRKAVLG